MGYTKRQETGTDVERVRSVRRVLWGILGLNLLVAFAKLAYGLATGSVAMTADGFHSLFDGTSNVVGIVGIAVAARPADREHPYGHTKYETYASAVIGAMLLIAAWEVGSAAWEKLFANATPARVTLESFAIMIGTLLVNIGVTTWERRVGHRLQSDILLADASHTGSDIIVSLGVIAGLLAVRLGFPEADPLIALGVAGAIVHTAWGVMRQADETLSDRARMATAEICECAGSVEGVLGCHSVRTRGTAADVYVDLHIQVDPSMSVEAGHAVAEAVERRIADRFEQVADVIVHLEPMDEYQRRKTDRQVDGSIV